MQQVLTVYNEYLLYTTNTYSIQQVCTLQQVLFYTTCTYNMQPVSSVEIFSPGLNYSHQVKIIPTRFKLFPPGLNYSHQV